MEPGSEGWGRRREVRFSAKKSGHSRPKDAEEEVREGDCGEREGAYGGLGAEWRSWRPRPRHWLSPTSIAGKTPAQIFANTCNACHRSPREIKRTDCCVPARALYDRRPGGCRHGGLISPPAGTAPEGGAAAAQAGAGGVARSRRRARSPRAKPEAELNGVKPERRRTAGSRRPSDELRGDKSACAASFTAEEPPAAAVERLRIVPGLFRLRGIARISLFGSASAPVPASSSSSARSPSATSGSKNVSASASASARCCSSSSRTVVTSSPRAIRAASSALRATVTLMLTSTSGCSDTGTLYRPIVLIGALSAICGAVELEAASVTSATMSRGDTEP